MKALIDISRETYKDFARNDGWLCPNSCSDIANAMTKAIIMPENVTNGDVIKALFPETKTNVNGFIVECELEAFGFNVEEDWWNASYNQVSNIRKAHWKKISPARIYECTECGQNVMTGNIECYKFCHGCGASMKGE